MSLGLLVICMLYVFTMFKCRTSRYFRQQRPSGQSNQLSKVKIEIKISYLPIDTVDEFICSLDYIMVQGLAYLCKVTIGN